MILCRENWTEIRTVHALSGRTIDNKFIEWFLPQYTSARGRKNLGAWVFLAAEFFTNTFSDVWTKQIENMKHSQSKKKVSGIGKIDYNIYAYIIKNLVCICPSRNFLLSTQRIENWFCLNNLAKPCNILFIFITFSVR